jgi:enoyl-CoA hydratase/carnithine racemase
MESARISAQDALAFGLLDEIVEESDLIDAAIGIIHRWVQPGAATTAHLQLLRPPLAAIEQAIAPRPKPRATPTRPASHAPESTGSSAGANDAPTGSSHPSGDPQKARS